MKMVWRRHTTILLVFGVLAIIIATAIAFVVDNFSPQTDVRLGATVYSVTVADTEEKRIQGLSGVESLGPNEGMLFDFGTTGLWGIWMKDMRIPIDIIWLDESKKVITIVKDAPPELGETKTYTPTAPARYVLEVQAGASQRDGIKIGDTAQFEVQR